MQDNAVWHKSKAAVLPGFIHRFRWNISIGGSLHLHTDGGKSLMPLYRKLNWLGFE